MAWNSTYFGQFLCPSSGVYSLYTQQWYMSYRTSWSCLKAFYKPVWHTPLLSVQRINSWWWTEELSEKCRVPCQNKFVKLVHLVGFIIKKSDDVVSRLEYFIQRLVLKNNKNYYKTLCFAVNLTPWTNLLVLVFGLSLIGIILISSLRNETNSVPERQCFISSFTE